MLWILNAVYLLLLTCIAPLGLYRRFVLKKRFGNWREKLLGQLPLHDSNADPKQIRVWIHAVSVGEVVQLKSVLSALQHRYPDARFLISTTTTTGHAVARKLYPEHEVAYFPLDFSWTVSNALRRVQPDLIVLVELELWPNFVRLAADRRIPVAVINGRLSERSFQGYLRIRFLLASCLRRLSLIAVQTETYAARFRALGAPPELLHVTGSIKFDGVETDRSRPQTESLRKLFHIPMSARVFIAGSTQAPEEQYALETYYALRNSHPDLRLILVPRHQERFDEVANLVEAMGLPLQRRSHLLPTSLATNASEIASSPRDEPPVILLDTLGELSSCWGLADIAFVGGSLTRRGGQNMIEPAGYGAAVLFGPNTQNFRDVVALLRAGNAALVVNSSEELSSRVNELLSDPKMMAEYGLRSRELVLTQRGATEKTVSVLTALLPEVARTSLQRAA